MRIKNRGLPASINSEFAKMKLCHHPVGQPSAIMLFPTIPYIEMFFVDLSCTYTYNLGLLNLFDKDIIQRKKLNVYLKYSVV